MTLTAGETLPHRVQEGDPPISHPSHRGIQPARFLHAGNKAALASLDDRELVEWGDWDRRCFALLWTCACAVRGARTLGKPVASACEDHIHTPDSLPGANAFGVKCFLDCTWRPKRGRWLCKNKMFLELSSFHFCLFEFWEVGGWQEGDQF